MNILILGYSSVVKRRVLPALFSLGSVANIYIATHRKQLVSKEVAVYGPRVSVLNGYKEALSTIDPCLAYISLPNSEHVHWTEKALNAGFHVAVEKPGTLCLEDATLVTEIAKQKKLCLAETVVWPYHPQVLFMRRLLNQVGSDNVVIKATFTVPPFDENNFRLKRNLGGGCFYDMSAYAISTGRVFLGDTPQDIRFQRLDLESNSCEVDTGFFCESKYSSNKLFFGLYGFGLCYVNSMEIITPNLKISSDKIYSPSPDEVITVLVSERGEASSHKFSGDVYKLFFNELINSINTQNFEYWSEILMNDAKSILQ
ncbi:Gfo/Idh/MocA family oxidoreductase [Polynucleobacter paneuropaeus]|jgi:predicted dehydrogenase|nr:Gfo/Idh/MocA family oxidoreductase [Polynucleobacter paneuropaeus]